MRLSRNYPIDVNMKIARYPLGQGRHDGALKSYEDTLNARIGTPEYDHEDTLQIRSIVASIFMKQMRYDEAFQMFKDIFLTRLSMLRNTHPGILEKACCTGTLLISQGKGREVEKVCRDVELVLEEPCYKLYLQGNLNEALILCRKIYKNVTEFLCSKSPTVQKIRAQIGFICLKTEKYEEALEVYGDMYRKRLEIYGPDHKTTLCALMNKAHVLLKKCEFADAVLIFDEVHEKRKKTLGDQHRKTLCSLKAVGKVYSEQGDYNIAQDLFQSVIEAYHKQGNDKCEMWAKTELATSYCKQGKYENALEVWTEIHEFQNAKYPNHPDILTTYSKMAEVHLLQAKNDEAKRMYEVIKESTITPEVEVDAEKNIAVILTKQKDYSSAHEIFSELTKKSDRILGPEHSITLSIQNNLGILLCSQGCYKKALDIYEKVLDARSRSLGSYHPDTLMALCAIASVYASQREYDAALRLYNEIRRLMRSTLLPEHLDCLYVDTEIAELYLSKKKYNEAFQIYYDVYERKADMYGVDHRYTSEVKEKMRYIKPEPQMLITATEEAHLVAVKSCLENWDDIDIRDVRGYTPLHIASAKGDAEMLKLFLKNGAIYEVKNMERKTPKDIASNNRVKKILNLVRSLFISVEENDCAQVREILEQEKEIINARDKYGYTPLHWACHKGYINIVVLLLRIGVNYKAVTREGGTALHEAAFRGHSGIISTLLNHVKYYYGTKELEKFINVKATTVGKTALHLAAHRNNLRSVKTLLDYGANPTLKSIHEKLPSDLTRNSEIKELLSTRTVNLSKNKFFF